MKRYALIPTLLLVLGLIASACGNKSTVASEGQKLEHRTQQEIENNFAKGQPVPALTNSQVRENLIEIEEAIAEGVQTTSFFFNLGVVDPTKTCPSIGVPIPASSQLTNPDQVIDSGDHNRTVLPQMDPTGVYAGDTTGTYVLCINAQGEAYVSYWEGYVLSEFAAAKWNHETHEVELLGRASWNFSEHTAPSGTDPANNPNK